MENKIGSDYVKEKIVNYDDMGEAFAIYAYEGGRKKLGEILLEMNSINQEKLLQYFASKLGEK